MHSLFWKSEFRKFIFRFSLAKNMTYIAEKIAQYKQVILFLCWYGTRFIYYMYKKYITECNLAWPVGHYRNWAR